MFTKTPNPSGPRNFPPTLAAGRATSPVILSSTAASDSYNTRGKIVNTGQCRKSLSGRNVMAEATKATREVMATQMKEMAEASRELKRSKIEVQLKLFEEQMAYQRDKDRRLYENSVIANENARLAIQKQGEVVEVLAQLSKSLCTIMSKSSLKTELAEPSSPATSKM